MNKNGNRGGRPDVSRADEMPTEDVDGAGEDDVSDYSTYDSYEPDEYELDADGDGVDDTVAVDIDGDGVIDVAGVDLDGDGVIDAAGVDIDGDGVMDATYTDADGDGVVDEADVYASSAGYGGTGTNTGTGWPIADPYEYPTGVGYIDDANAAIAGQAQYVDQFAASHGFTYYGMPTWDTAMQIGEDHAAQWNPYNSIPGGASSGSLGWYEDQNPGPWIGPSAGVYAPEVGSSVAGPVGDTGWDTGAYYYDHQALL